MSRYLEPEQIVALYDALDAGMSQRKVAEIIGCSVSVVNDWKQKRDRGEFVPEEHAVLDWNKIEDRALAAWELCRQTPSVDDRMDLLRAVIWPSLDVDDNGCYGRDHQRELIDGIKSPEIDPDYNTDLDFRDEDNWSA